MFNRKHTKNGDKKKPKGTGKGGYGKVIFFIAAFFVGTLLGDVANACDRVFFNRAHVNNRVIRVNNNVHRFNNVQHYNNFNKFNKFNKFNNIQNRFLFFDNFAVQDIFVDRVGNVIFVDRFGNVQVVQSQRAFLLGFNQHYKQNLNLHGHAQMFKLFGEFLRTLDEKKLKELNLH